MVEPTVISTFAGTGGSSLGYKWAGFKELLAIDFDAHAVECFRLNFPEVPVWHKSVTDITGDQILKFCNIKKGELDVFDGSPPCQGFSTAGKREVSDPRNDLFKHYVRLIGELEPKVFVMENVTGMAKGKMRGKFIEIIKELKALNYNVKCKKLNAMWYNVPQSRERLIFIGVRKDLNRAPTYPRPSSKVISIKDIDPTFNRKVVSFRVKGGDHQLSSVHKPAPAIMKDGGHTILNGKQEPFPLDLCKQLCSFPVAWKLSGNRAQQYARLGNAVMPKFMQAIAETIKHEILDTKETAKASR